MTAQQKTVIVTGASQGIGAAVVAAPSGPAACTNHLRFSE